MMTYFAGYWVSILFEVPLLGLEKFIFPKPKAHSTLKKRNQIIDSNKELVSSSADHKEEIELKSDEKISKF